MGWMKLTDDWGCCCCCCGTRSCCCWSPLQTKRCHIDLNDQSERLNLRWRCLTCSCFPLEPWWGWERCCSGTHWRNCFPSGDASHPPALSLQKGPDINHQINPFPAMTSESFPFFYMKNFIQNKQSTHTSEVLHIYLKQLQFHLQNSKRKMWRILRLHTHNLL